MDKVLYEKRNRIGYVTLNRPEALNALDDDTNAELWSVWDDFAKDESLDVAILTGAGKAFCSGADLKTFIPREKANKRHNQTCRNDLKPINSPIFLMITTLYLYK
jgi:enoyl-CoA hydratase